MTVHVASSPSLAIRSERLSITDQRIGAVPDTSDDQGPALQTGIELAATSNDGRGSLFFPPGVYRNDSTSLVLSSDRAITMMGVGGAVGGGSTIQTSIAGDFGAGQALLVVDGSTVEHHIEKMRFYGPRNAAAVHDDPAAMDGVHTTGEVKIVDCEIIGFKRGLSVLNPRVQVVSSILQGNTYGIWWSAGSRGGDVFLDRTALDAQAKGSVGIDPDAEAVNVTMFQLHLGFVTTYCFYRPGTPDVSSGSPSMLRHLVAAQCSMESPANGNLYDEPGDGVCRDLSFFNNPEADLMSPLPDVDLPEIGGWKCDTIKGFWTYGMGPQQTLDYPTFTCRTLENVGQMDPWFMLGGLVDPTYVAKRAWVTAGGDGIAGVTVGQPGTEQGAALVASSPVGQFDVVQMDGLRTVKTHTGAVTERAIGIALHDTDAGDVCNYWTSGQFVSGVVKVASGRSVSQWDHVKADPSNPGYVMAVTSLADANVVGQVLGSVTGPAEIDARLHLEGAR